MTKTNNTNKINNTTTQPNQTPDTREAMVRAQIRELQIQTIANVENGMFYTAIHDLHKIIRLSKQFTTIRKWIVNHDAADYNTRR